MTEAFQVDLRGVVDLLSQHLYSSPRVYLRELLQNAVDALTVRSGVHGPAAVADQRPGVLVLPADVADDGHLHVLDTGDGLDVDQVGQFLATIGRSSKRDEIGLARSDLLGQFGIGLLSCFLVSDDITVLTRSAHGDAAQVVCWQGRSDGTYSITETTLEALPPGPDHDWLAQGPGTCVRLLPRRGEEHWLAAATVLDLARTYASRLPHDIRVAGGGAQTIEIAPTAAPWDLADPRERQRASTAYAQDVLGVRPLAVLPLDLPVAGLRGMAVIVDQATVPGAPQAHRVYLKGMLLSERVQGLLPEWAFFARCVIDASGLRPTASREELYEDATLEGVRTALGDQLRRWLVRLAQMGGPGITDFLTLHQRAVKAMALHDPEMLAIVLPLLGFETATGTMTLAEVRRTHDRIQVASTVDEFRQLAPFARAQGLCLINGGYTFDQELVERFPELDPTVTVQVVTGVDVHGWTEPVGLARQHEIGDRLAGSGTGLADLGVDVELRSFVPATLPALYVDDEGARRTRESRQVAADADDAWAGVLAGLDSGEPARPRLLLNDANDAVRKILSVHDVALRRVAVESLYCRALLQGHHPMRPADEALLDQSFLSLLDRALSDGVSKK